ncbi:metal-dependent transcriptional regulator [Microbacterium sp. NRRL B-14842]|uniref:metal-dependent transcriptional regulator n=1 Tax=Microbacterium sp. NRRL B-14842 TaxID=3162881 RepID=UPI003D284550
MVKKLAAAGLVSHVPYGAVRLTEAGTTRALAMVRRHRLIETWLVQEFGYGWDEVHDEAEVLSTPSATGCSRASTSAWGGPRFDPHGRRHPGRGGPHRTGALRPARRCPEGHTGRVLRVDDRDPELLRTLEAQGLTVGTTVTVTPFGIALDGTEPPLPRRRPATWCGCRPDLRFESRALRQIGRGWVQSGDSKGKVGPLG